MVAVISLAVILLILLYFSNYKLSQSLSIIIFSALILNLIVKILNKKLSEFTDYLAYLSAFNSIAKLDFIGMLKTDIFEIMFRIMAWVFMSILPNSTFIIFVILINMILAISIYRFFDNKILSIFSLLIYTYSPLFFNMSTNILRQMLVISIIMLVLTLNREKKWISLIFPTIHLSSFGLIIFMYFQKHIKIKYFIYFSAICLFMFITNLNSKMFSSLPIISDYTSQQTFEDYGGQPNRIDFLIFTIVIVILSIVLYKLNLISILWLKYSLFSASYYLMFAFQAFSERYAIYNWILLVFLLPLILKAIKRRYT